MCGHDSFSLLVIGDTQVKDHEQLSFVRDSFVNRALGTEAHLALAGHPHTVEHLRPGEEFGPASDRAHMKLNP